MAGFVRISISIFFVGFGFWGALAFASDGPDSASEHSKSNSFWANRYDELVSPWTTAARPWLLYGSAITLALVISEDQISDPTQEETIEDKPLGSASAYGDLAGQLIPNALYVLGMGLHYWYTKNEASSNAAWAMFKASAYSGFAAQSLKYFVHEPRPNNTSGARSYESFPSGHTTSAFAFSSTVIAQNGLWPYGLMATTLASFSGFSRMNDNKHYLHDVSGGMVVGISYGLGISYLQKNKKLESSKQDTVASNWTVLPAYSEDMKGVVGYFDF